METIRIDCGIKKPAYGFSLVEMAVVLVILGFVMSALILPITAQRDANFFQQTENQLEQARKALIGFAQTNGRLPCPALDMQGIEAVNGVYVCSGSNGLLPAATLGVELKDGWGNPLRYAVSQAAINAADGTSVQNYAVTTPNAMTGAEIALQRTRMRVCNSAVSSTPTMCSGAPEANYRINNAVAVIYSTGATGAQGPRSVDENVNLDGSNVFVSRDVNTTDFDDLVTWISPYVLYNAMIQAGQLP